MHTTAIRKDAPEVPNFSHYEAKDQSTNRAVSYVMIGSFGLLSASVAKSTVTEFLVTMSASARCPQEHHADLSQTQMSEGSDTNADSPCRRQ